MDAHRRHSHAAHGLDRDRGLRARDRDALPTAGTPARSATLGAFSFYVTKNVVTAEGGMVTTADERLAARLKVLALHGLSADAWKRFSDEGYQHYEVVEPGFKYNMTDLQAALGIHQLARVEENLRRRRGDLEALRRGVRRPAGRRRRRRRSPTPATLATSTRCCYGSRTSASTATACSRRSIARTSARACTIAPFICTSTTASGSATRPRTSPSPPTSPRGRSRLPLSPKLTDDDVDDVILGLRRVLEHYAR